jgi:hypothetical protein
LAALSVRFRQIPAAHNAESDSHIVIFQEGRDDRVNRPLATGENMGVGFVEREKPAAVLQRETRSACFTNYFFRPNAWTFPSQVQT